MCVYLQKSSSIQPGMNPRYKGRLSRKTVTAESTSCRRSLANRSSWAQMIAFPKGGFWGVTFEEASLKIDHWHRSFWGWRCHDKAYLKSDHLIVPAATSNLIIKWFHTWVLRFWSKLKHWSLQMCNDTFIHEISKTLLVLKRRMNIDLNFPKTSRGSFSAVSTPIFANI